MLSVTAAYIPLSVSLHLARSLDTLKMWQICLIAAVLTAPSTSWPTEDPTTAWPKEEPAWPTEWTTEALTTPWPSEEPTTPWPTEYPTTDWPTEEPTENPSTTTPESCPIGWIDNGALGCYLFSADREGLSWIEALEYCEEQVCDHKNLFPITSRF